MLIPALLCDRCHETRHTRATIDDGRALMHDAVKNGWLVQHIATDHTYGRAVCPHCRAAGCGRSWS